jgi:predicted flap endonuclease-1-like 5' DNA nuclease
MDWLNLSGFQFDWLSFVLGALTGWLIEWLIDFFYWRRKRNRWEDAESALRSELASTQGVVGDLRLQVAKDGDLNRQLVATRTLLDARIADITQLETAVEDGNTQIAALEGQVNQSVAERELLADRHYAALAVVTTELDTLRTRLDQVTIEKQDLEAEVADLKSRNMAMEISGATRAVEIAALSAAVAQASVEPPDDLTIIEGIGPKIEELLNQNDIRTFERLADTEVEDLYSILRSGGSHFNMADPETWPRQARLAANRDWNKLDVLKAQLVAGVRKPVEAGDDVAQRSQTVAIPADDLTIIEGIGPKIEELLNQNDIRTFERLADSDVEDLYAILRAGGSQFNMADPETWPRQARLAANRDWNKLDVLKAQLVAGVRKPAATEAESTRAAAVPESPDDLTIIEGIGPNIDELLNRNVIQTFKQLAA